VTALLGAADVARVLKRLVHQLVEREEGAADLLLLGNQTRGVPLDERLAALVGDIEGTERRERGVPGHEGGPDGARALR
jgi:pyrimidine operon attenuation protein / uracil phosphoribosyltransferase